MKVKSIIKLVLTVLIIAAISLLAIFGLTINGKTYIPKAQDGIKFGLDIKGGVSVMYEAKDGVTEEEAKTVIQIMRSRLDAKGYTEATVIREGDNRFNVEIPEVTDVNEVLEILGTTAKLSFVDPEGNLVLEGADVSKAQATTINDQITNIAEYVVSLKLNSEGATKFADATTKFVGQPIYIMLDDAIISMPTVNEAITTGEAIISGDFTFETADQLATLISSGSLPVELEQIYAQKVDATLGAGSLENAVKAALIALVIIMLFMIAFYRLPGLMASIALCGYTAFVVVVLAIGGVNLTLSGIAGIVLSMGMAVDANVVIFERIIDELKLGKSIAAAVDSGFDRALAAVVDSNVTTIISSLALYFLGTGTVKGFAITLLIGVIVSMFTAIIVTKFLLKRMVELNVKNRKLYGFGVKA